jgi:alpha-tubulin suppressor-like RCC1 family protein
MLTSGTLYCWGNNNRYQLGISPMGYVTAPTAQLSAGSSYDAQINYFALGAEHGCAITTAQLLWCWGYSITNKATGYAVNGYQPTPRRADWRPITGQGGTAGPTWASSAVTAVAAGDTYTCVIQGTSVRCMGKSPNGQVGKIQASGSFDSIVSGIVGTPVALDAGLDSTCARTSQSRVFCWGNNTNSKIGATNTDAPSTVNSTANFAVAQEVPAAAGTTKVDVGASTTCAVTGTQTKCWGDSSNGITARDGVSGDRVLPTVADTCATGSRLLINSDTLCSLVSTATYYYKLSYTYRNWSAPTSTTVRISP